MEEIDPKTVQFFEGILQHGPVREILIKQFMLLDSLTLIRLSKSSPFLKNYIENNINLWLPRIQEQVKKTDRNWPILYYEESKRFPGMYLTSLIFLIFPSFLDVFLFFVSYRPHVWLRNKPKDKEFGSTQDVINYQDWDVIIKDQKNAFDLNILKSFYIYDVFLWTKSKHDIEKGILAHNDFVRRYNYSKYRNLIMRRQFHDLELVPRIGCWFKYFDKDVSFVFTNRLPQKPWPVCDISLNIIVSFKNGHEGYFVFNNYIISKVVPPFYKPSFEKNAIRLHHYSFNSIDLLHIKDAKKLISPYFSLTFFHSLMTTRVYVYSEEMAPRFREYRNLKEMVQDKNGVVLIVENITPFKHYAPENQSEFLIESCIECQKPVKFKCAGCHRAVYCGRECAKKGWEDGMHSDVCEIISKNQSF